MNDNHECAVCGKAYGVESDFLADTRRWRVCANGHLWFNCRCGSTMMIKKGKYPWYSPDRLMSEEARGVFNRLGNLKNLPHLPSTVMTMQKMLADPEVEPRKLAAELRRDPLLGGQVLKSAERLRSSRSNISSPITSLEHAIVYIGMRALSDILISSAMHTFVVPKSGFKAHEFWEHAYLTGAIAEHLMQRHNPALNADEVYVAASLCNVGKLVLACCFPPLATKISREITKPETPTTWRAAEKSFNFPDHVILGEIAASLWALPDYVMQATRHHHDALSSDSKTPLLIQEIAAVANQLAHRVTQRPHLVEAEIFESYKKRVGAVDDDIEALVEDGLEIKIRLADLEPTQPGVVTAP